ncbi:hypothetical protein ACIQU3_14185 [Streptomyces sp. NPDC101110]|uniref:hypothetical protein n=1 Tax=unclassified Streptomyces TaxID=2593676 RepID=UPI0037F3B8CB
MPDINTLVTFFGETFLTYIGDLDPVAKRKEGELTPETVSILDSICMSTAYQDPQTRWMNVAASIMRYVGPADISLGNYLRQLNGGDPVVLETTDDELHNQLITVAAALYPAFLVKRPDGEPLNGTLACGGEFMGHPQGLSFLVGALRDPDISKLFPGVEPPVGQELGGQARSVTGVESFLATSKGGVQILRLHSLGEHILNNAFHRLVVQGGEVSLQTFLAQVGEVLGDIRRLGRGESIGVTVAVGLSRLGLECKGIKLGDERIVKREFFYGRQGDGSPWAPIVLLARQEYKIYAIKSVVWRDSMFEELDPTPYVDRTREWHSAMELRVDRCCLSIFLASGAARPTGAVVDFTAILDPFTHYPVEPWQSRPSPNVSGISLTQAAADEVASWYSRVGQNHAANLDVCIRRMVSACNSRYTPSDSLLDAVLAWENMFSGTPETVLRVCGALSSLLAADTYKDRAELFSEMKKIYTARSQIVHGKTKRTLTEDVIRAHADKAIEYAFKALRKLYDCPEVLALKDSDARGMAVLMGIAHDRGHMLSEGDKN